MPIYKETLLSYSVLSSSVSSLLWSFCIRETTFRNYLLQKLIQLNLFIYMKKQQAYSFTPT